MRKTRVLIVEDSPTMQMMIAGFLARDPRLSVVGVASDANAARAAIRALNPDVITLDIEMPCMDGLEFLRRLIRLRPMPVVMLSSLARRGRQKALEALALGAVDCVEKPGGMDFERSLADLPDRLIRASKLKVMPNLNKNIPKKNAGDIGRIILIGASTGGVDALETILGGFSADCPPTLVVQHMAEHFLENLVVRLDRKIQPQIALAEQNTPIRRGLVLLAPGNGMNLTIRFDGARRCELQKTSIEGVHLPSVNALFLSALPIARQVTAAILTGMGRDGADGMLALRRAGAATIAQDQATSVIFGMPHAAIECGAVEVVAPLEGLATLLLDEKGVPNAAQQGGGK